MAKIQMKLTTRSIEDAIKEVKEYKRKLNDRVKALIRELVDKGVEIAKAQVRDLGAVYTGQLEESITGFFDEETGLGIIRTDCPYAIYVEFGTGVVGERNPHPEPIEGWQYDVNEHGDKGWWYFNERDQKWHWTKGMVSRPFMYNTLQLLRAEAEKGGFKVD
ncbi:MAG TPA: HK97 gp10 family phage protein [Tissierellia bacterium]|nr:HK97 gp10 family phage protein [Tissierellia bacterium]